MIPHEEPSHDRNQAGSSAARAWVKRGLDLLYPPQCLSCGTSVTETGTLCGTCWADANFITDPQCWVCGYPFPYDMGKEAVCGACAAAPPAYDHARAAMVYNDRSRELILAFKHGDRTDRAPALGRWLIQAGTTLISKADMVTPVPLHWTRSFARRFNQSALLAKVVARQGNIEFAPEVLTRHRRTPSQGRLNAGARQRNVQGAFTAPKKHQDRIKGKRILLIDDVLTTGATVAACASVLRRTGATGVDVLTVARVVRETT